MALLDEFACLERGELVAKLQGCQVGHSTMRLGFDIEFCGYNGIGANRCSKRHKSGYHGTPRKSDVLH